MVHSDGPIDPIFGAGFDDDKLPHHPVVLMSQNVAVVHVGHEFVGVLEKLHCQFDIMVRPDEHGVFRTTQGGRRLFTIHLLHMEGGAMNVEGMRLAIGRDFPHLRAPAGIT